MASFDLFPKLPETIRHNVWRQVASTPRVVGVIEDHRLGWMDDWQQGKKETRMYFTTRPPAILSVCREAREIGLTIYKRMEEGIQYGSNTSQDTRIYVNPEVDITYRGKMSCRKGDMFRIRCRDWSEDTEPLAMTRTLAVDARAVTRFRDAPSELLSFMGMTYPEKEWDKLIENMCISMYYMTKDEVIKCCEQGVREIIFVVGNDDDLSEITLVPLDTDPLRLSARETRAVEAAEEFSSSLGRYWEQQKVSCPFPIFKVMTVQRKPLKEFTLFPRLPTEIQLSIWDFASVNYPRVLTMITDDDDETGLDVCNYRSLAIAHACKNSRYAIWKGLDLSNVDAKAIFYEPLNDAILLRKQGLGTSYRNFSKKEYKSIAIRFDNKRFWDTLSAADVKTFTGLERVVILFGNLKASCEMTMVPIPEEQPPRGQVYEWSKTSLARAYAKDLREDLEKTSKKWKAYQKRRVKQGKSSPDWVVPKVEVAYLKPICETMSPYSY
jgi:hypothetical protein